MGMHVTLCSNKKYFPDPALVRRCEELAAESGGSVRLTEDTSEAASGADVFYTDVWVSMGEPDEVWQERIHDLLPYRVTSELMQLGSADAVFMHCLPAFHDLHTGSRSIVFQEAENRMHTIKAVMAATLGYAE